MKILFISNISNGVGTFAMASLKAAQKMGAEFHIAANFSSAEPGQLEKDEAEYGVHLHQIDFERSPLKPGNIKAYRQAAELIKREDFDVIHCNTPIGGIVGRLAGSKCRVKKVIYQAHGFHFYKGAPVKNWLIYYPIERLLAHKTDALITINKEDRVRAKRFHLRHSGSVYYVPGVGIDMAEYDFSGFDRAAKRAELGLAESDICVISAGDLIKRKNYETAVKAVAAAGNKNIHYFVCGKGPLKEDLEALAKRLGVENNVHFLGFRTDIKELLNAADIFLFTTLQEGLPRSLSEAMAAGLPCVASKIRGNTDLTDGGKCGFLCGPKDYKGFASALLRLSKSASLREKTGTKGKKNLDKFSLDAATAAVLKVYKRELGDF